MFKVHNNKIDLNEYRFSLLSTRACLSVNSVMSKMILAREGRATDVVVVVAVVVQAGASKHPVEQVSLTNVVSCISVLRTKEDGEK